MRTTRGPLPSKQQLPQAAEQATFSVISSVASVKTRIMKRQDATTAASGPFTMDAGGVVYEEWRNARRVISPKKGNLSPCKNWRGNCLLDVCSKLLSSMLVRQLKIVMEVFRIDAQTGFCLDRGTIDGLFTTFVGLHNCKEDGLGMWALLIDLVKAFDSLPREALFPILHRFGWPDHLVNEVIRIDNRTLYTNW
jgi:hypothetical protein